MKKKDRSPNETVFCNLLITLWHYYAKYMFLTSLICQIFSNLCHIAKYWNFDHIKLLAGSVFEKEWQELIHFLSVFKSKWVPFLKQKCIFHLSIRKIETQIFSHSYCTLKFFLIQNFIPCFCYWLFSGN